MDDNAFTDLHHAVLRFDIDKVQILLEQGADPNLQTPQGFPPLHLLFYRLPSLEMVQDLCGELEGLDLRKGLNKRSQDKFNQGALDPPYDADENIDKLIQLMKLFKEHGYDLDGTSKTGIRLIDLELYWRICPPHVHAWMTSHNITLPDFTLILKRYPSAYDVIINVAPIYIRAGSINRTVIQALVSKATIKNNISLYRFALNAAPWTVMTLNLNWMFDYDRNAVYSLDSAVQDYVSSVFRPTGGAWYRDPSELTVADHVYWEHFSQRRRRAILDSLLMASVRIVRRTLCKHSQGRSILPRIHSLHLSDAQKDIIALKNLLM